MCVCVNVSIIKIQVPLTHEVKHQRGIAKRTSQIIWTRSNNKKN